MPTTSDRCQLFRESIYCLCQIWCSYSINYDLLHAFFRLNTILVTMPEGMLAGIAWRQQHWWQRGHNRSDVSDEWDVWVCDGQHLGTMMVGCWQPFSTELLWEIGRVPEDHFLLLIWVSESWRYQSAEKYEQFFNKVYGMELQLCSIVRRKSCMHFQLTRRYCPGPKLDSVASEVLSACMLVLDRASKARLSSLTAEKTV